MLRQKTLPQRSAQTLPQLLHPSQNFPFLYKDSTRVLGLPGDQPLLGAHPTTSLEQKTLLVLLSLRNLQGFSGSCARTGVKKKQILEQEIACIKCSYHLANYEGFYGALCQNQEHRPIYICLPHNHLFSSRIKTKPSQFLPHTTVNQ